MEIFSRCMCNPMYFYRLPTKLREGDVSQGCVCRGGGVPRSLPGVEAGWYPWLQVISRGVGIHRGGYSGVSMSRGGYSGESTQRGQSQGQCVLSTQGLGIRGESVKGVGAQEVEYLRGTWR